MMRTDEQTRTEYNSNPTCDINLLGYALERKYMEIQTQRTHARVIIGARSKAVLRGC